MPTTPSPRHDTLQQLVKEKHMQTTKQTTSQSPGPSYQGHTKNPSSSSRQKDQPYVFSGYTGMGFRMAGATSCRLEEGGYSATSSSSHLKSQPCIPGEYVGLVFLVGPTGVALVSTPLHSPRDANRCPIPSPGLGKPTKHHKEQMPDTINLFTHR